MKFKMLEKLLLISCLLISAGSANAIAIPVPFSGVFNESDILAEGGQPAGDYDTIGGLQDTALFNLIVGANEFYGSINSPSDATDFFNVGIGAGLRLIGASIDWGTNLPGLQYGFIGSPPTGFLQQSTWGANAPTWFFEESSITPEIFTIRRLEAGAVGSTFDISPKSYVASAFSRGEGIYNSLLNASGTCAQSYVANFPGVSSFCADRIDYKMTYFVEALQVPPPPTPNVSSPSAFALFGLGLIALVSRKLKKHA